VELRSQAGKKVTTLKRGSLGAAKAPPRPTPGSVTYTDDESDKAYDNNPDESSLTEKPSEISSTDSQVLLRPNKNYNKLKAFHPTFYVTKKKFNRVSPVVESSPPPGYSEPLKLNFAVETIC